MDYNRTVNGVRIQPRMGRITDVTQKGFFTANLCLRPGRDGMSPERYKKIQAALSSGKGLQGKFTYYSKSWDRELREGAHLRAIRAERGVGRPPKAFR